MVCPNCYGSEFRLSRLRWTDIERLALLQYPVRCRNCRERSYGGFLLAFYLYQVRRHHRNPGTAD